MRNRQDTSGEYTTLDKITDKSNGPSLLERAQNNNDQTQLNQYYKEALTFFRQQAKSSGIKPENNLGLDPAQVDSTKNQRTILYWAIACFQSEATINQLLELGSKTDERYMDDFVPSSAFFTALKLDNMVAMQALLKENPALATKKHMQTATTPGNFLVEKNKLEALEILLKTDNVIAEVGAGITLLTPLHAAIEFNNIDAANLILKYNQNACNTPDFNGCTPLHTAVIIGNAELVELLLQNGADTEVITHNNYPEHPNKSPLQIAASMRNNDVVRLLLLHKARLNREHPISINGLSAEMLAAVRLTSYIATRSSQDRFTNAVTNGIFAYTGYQAGYPKEEKLPVARKVLQNILHDQVDALNDLSKKEMSILKDGRLQEIMQDLIDLHEFSSSSGEDHSGSREHSYSSDDESQRKPVSP